MMGRMSCLLKRGQGLEFSFSRCEERVFEGLHGQYLLRALGLTLRVLRANVLLKTFELYTDRDGKRAFVNQGLLGPLRWWR